MDPASTLLGKMLVEEITPVVIIVSTALVEEASFKNGLSFVQILQPFCAFNNIDVPVRTANDQPYRLQKFKLRLFYASDAQHPNFEVAKGCLKDVITHAGEHLPDLSSDHLKIEHVLTASQSELLPSWFNFYNRELVRSSSFSDHEAFDHPVACLLVVSSKDEQPINTFVDLFNSDQVLTLLNDGMMDPKILKQYLLVHDCQDGSSDKATRILTEMKSTFGSNDCLLLSINSSQDGPIFHDDNPWDLYQTDPSFSNQLGCFLNTDDFCAIKDFMQDLSLQRIIPHMEQKIRMLNQQVSVTRKGFRNQIKNLWWRKGKEDTPDAPDNPLYSVSSIESQIRVLGDFAFMLRDYELALTNYRLLSTDYKLDKAWKRYAGVQEMIALTYFMLDQSRKESEYCMENALNAYIKSGSTGLQNAIRCGLWWAEMLKTREQFREAAGVYFRILGEESLHSAVMLEQASYCYLFSRPPMLRKYAFHLVLAGDMYKRCDQINHAIRTYRRALSVYEGTSWTYVNDHVHYHLGKWYAFIGMLDIAAAHVLQVLACSHQPRTRQELFLKDFLQIVQKTGKMFEVSRLQLPVINKSSLKVAFQDHRTYASSAAVAVKESLWQSLEEDMLPSMPIIKPNWLETQSKLISKHHKELNICVTGEAVEVNIEFKNPLFIPISISNVSLVCMLSPNPNESESGSVKEDQIDEQFQKTTTCWGADSDTSSFTLSETDFSLAGGETVAAQVSVTPKIEGILKIIGIRWRLFGFVVGLCNFDSSPVKMNLSKGKIRPNCYIDCLNFAVIKNIQKLEGFIHYLPEKVYLGDLRSPVLELRNHSEFPVKNMKMKISNPRCLGIGRHRIWNLDHSSFLERKDYSEEIHEGVESNDISTSVFSFPEDILVQGESPLLWPLWFRAAALGNISLHITIYYEMGNASSVMRYRTFRMIYNLEVMPSLDVLFQISPCPSRLEDFMVRVEVVNMTSSETFKLHQLSTVGSKWEVSLLQPLDSIFPSQLLTAGQTFSCFFRLKDCRELGGISEFISHQGSDVNLGIPCSGAPVFDISKSPLADFHKFERLHAEISHQGHPVTVDFILISEAENNIMDPALPHAPLFLSHHACHCIVAGMQPIWWLVDGCQTIYHDFSTSFCETKLKMTIHNPSDMVSFVCLDTIDSTNTPPAVEGDDSSGWRDASDVRSASDGADENSQLVNGVSQFIWLGCSSNAIKVEAMSIVEIPVQVCIFSPGVIDLSRYALHWNSGDGEASGSCLAQPSFLTVLQSLPSSS